MKCLAFACKYLKPKLARWLSICCTPPLPPVVLALRCLYSRPNHPNYSLFGFKVFYMKTLRGVRAPLHHPLTLFFLVTSANKTAEIQPRAKIEEQSEWLKRGKIHFDCFFFWQKCLKQKQKLPLRSCLYTPDLQGQTSTQQTFKHRAQNDHANGPGKRVKLRPAGRFAPPMEGPQDFDAMGLNAPHNAS